MSTNQTTCKNCEQSFESDFLFCPHCGQKSKDELTLRVLFSNTLSNYFSVDARFFKSFFPLLFKPGYIARKFIEGKRLLYLHPAQMYLFISIVFFFLFSFKVREQEEALSTTFNTDQEIKNALKNIENQTEKDSLAAVLFIQKMRENQSKLGLKDKDVELFDSIVKENGYDGMNNVSFGFNEKKIDSLILKNADENLIYKEMGLDPTDGWLSKKMYKQMLKLYKSNGSVANVYSSFFDTIPMAIFVLLPIFALILKLFFFRRGLYAHHLVFAFYYVSFLFATFSILLLLNYIWSGFPMWLTSLLFLSTFVYFLIAVKRFYMQGWFLSLIKSILVTFIYMFFVLIVGLFFLGFTFLSF